MASPKRSAMARWLSGRGIELGALHQPLPVPHGAVVEYVDRLTVPELRQQYPELAALDLVPIAHIGSAENLAGLADATLDFVIACHVLEHLEDPTRGLQEIYRVLRDGGVFFCALPEPRVTFDRFRASTQLNHLMIDHPAGRTTRRAHYVDWVENVERHQAWWQTESPRLEDRVELLMDMDYSIHFHVWRPHDWLEYLSALRKERGLDFELLDFAGCQPTVDDEFIVILRKGTAPIPVGYPSGGTSPSAVAPGAGDRNGGDPIGARTALRLALQASDLAVRVSMRAVKQRLPGAARLFTRHRRSRSS